MKRIWIIYSARLFDNECDILTRVSIVMRIISGRMGFNLDFISADACIVCGHYVKDYFLIISWIRLDWVWASVRTSVLGPTIYANMSDTIERQRFILKWTMWMWWRKNGPFCLSCSFSTHEMKSRTEVNMNNFCFDCLVHCSFFHHIIKTTAASRSDKNPPFHFNTVKPHRISITCDAINKRHNWLHL